VRSHELGVFDHAVRIDPMHSRDAEAIPPAWVKNPAKNRQKDKDARWTKKHGKSFYGYKNHVNADAKHKLIRQYDVTDASVHDSRTFDGLLNHANTSADVYADSAYRLSGL
jgi:IS5 family transposase